MRFHVKRLLLTALLLAVFPAVAQTAGSGTFTITTEPVVATPGQVIARLTWSTSPAGATCVASGDWSGTKAASGTETLPPAPAPKAYSLRCTWAADSIAELSWTAPTVNSDGTPLARCAAATDTGPCLAKWRISHGTSATSLNDVRDHNFPSSTTATWSALPPGTHFFTVRAVNGQGIEGAPTNVASKVTSAGQEWTASVGVKVPGETTNLTAK